MKSELLAGLRFIDSIKSFVLTSESCSGFIGRIFDRGVVKKHYKFVKNESVNFETFFLKNRRSIFCSYVQ